ncbi:MAG: metal-dependent hydrolase [Pseudomonadales bacterium]
MTLKLHPIPVRRLTLAVPGVEDFDPIYMANQPAVSYSFTGLGLYVALLEPFIVKSLRRVLDRISDPELKENTDRFCRQEAQHYQQHERFNAVVLAQGYPGLQDRVDRLEADFRSYLEVRSDRFRVGFVEGFESYTTQGALEILSSRVCDHPRTNPGFGHLFRWHMLEEIEHRNVAFDVYQHLYGDYPYRAGMCWFAQRHMLRFISDCTRIMSAADVARHGRRCRVGVLARTVMALQPLPKQIRSMLPGYSPHHYRIPDSLADLSARYTELADSAL